MLPTRTVPRVFSFSARLTQAQLSSGQTLILYRTFASSSARLRATPVEEQKIVKPTEQNPYKYNPLSDSEDPYKGGPSAIDKAVHLFFFTEIIRGLFVFTHVHTRVVR
jgi:NADH dehydrogenase (ubiquinone) Fe-S protein 8